MDALADLHAMAAWGGGGVSVEVLQTHPDGRPRLARWRESYGPINDDFTLEYTWDEDTSVTWRLTKGRVLKKENGKYTLSPGGDGTVTVTYELEIGIWVWVLGIVRRQIEKSVIATALADLKSHVNRVGS